MRDLKLTHNHGLMERRSEEYMNYFTSSAALHVFPFWLKPPGLLLEVDILYTRN